MYYLTVNVICSSCTQEVHGCTDEIACNYNADATADDGSCEYPEEHHDCDGNCLIEVDCNGVCGGSSVVIDGICTNHYCAGDVIQSEDQNQEFPVCFGDCGCENWSLSDYSGDIIFLDMSASWCSPCYSSIDFIDELEEYWSGQNTNVKFITALADIGEPYSCQQWGLQGSPNNIIIEDDGSLFNWFHDTNAQYPNYVIIDHDMRVRAKPSGILSNSNNRSCDGGDYMESLDSDCLNSIITDLLDECGDGCSESTCQDTSACNYGDNADCIYSAANHDCCGECIAEVDCLGECGGDATEEDCVQASGGCPSCIIVPSDQYLTVQSGIDAALEGDTVLVEQGTYYENLIIQKTITLISRAAFEIDDEGLINNWMDYDGDGYFVANQNIVNTILDGNENSLNDSNFQSVILIDTPPGGGCITPLIIGFTITGGNGTFVTILDEEGNPIVQTQGGGFYSNNAIPTFNYNAFLDNGQSSRGDYVERGGGALVGMEMSFSILSDYTWGDSHNCDETRGYINLKYNAWSSNKASYGKTFAASNIENDIDMTKSFFDVYNCPDEEVTEVWVDVDEGLEVDFSQGIGDKCSIAEDVWVSPSGNDEYNLGTSESEAFLTIERAIEMIAPEEDNPITINLTAGTFAPSTTNEPFPILMISNVNLVGQGEDMTILDAEETDRVITINGVQNNIISHLTISNGHAYDTDTGSGTGGRGGGIYLSFADVFFNNIVISNNIGEEIGGGIFATKSNIVLSNAILNNNRGTWGGGICINWSNTNNKSILLDVIISDNSARHGGGIYASNLNPTLQNVIITNNQADGFFDDEGNWNDYGYGGGLYLDTSWPTLTNVTIYDNHAHNNAGAIRTVSNGVDCDGCTDLMNSIIWGNSSNNVESIWGSESHFNINYSNLEEGWDPEFSGEFLMSEYPDFANPDNGDFSLSPDSPCLNSANPSKWFLDLDGTIGDIGASGGLFVLPNFKSYDFGQVGDLVVTAEFKLFNYRNTSVTIDNVSFQTSSFNTTSNFPMVIQPDSEGVIPINCQPAILGYIEDSMTLISSDLPEGISVELSVVGDEGNLLSGSLSGTYPPDTYHIVNDIYVDQGTILNIQPGTIFQFDYGSNFTIEGILQAEGTKEDSIIFDAYSTSWEGFTFNNVTNETKLQYVRISRGRKNKGAGIYMGNSSPIITNVLVNANTSISVSGGSSGSGGGIYSYQSNPTLTNVKISDNQGTGNVASYGGGIYINGSKCNNGVCIEPILNNVVITKNTAHYGGGMYLSNSSSSLSNITISENSSIYNNIFSPAGIYLTYYSFPTITNAIVWGNLSNGIPTSINYGTTSDPIITFSNIQGDTLWNGAGNINDEPLFISETGDYTLQESSPCIDEGTADLDGDGVEDIFYTGLAPDMGAYEYGCPDNIYDSCGVCGGDNSSCLDACDVPNGDNSSCLDACDVPNGDNSTCTDDCGIINGDGWSCAPMGDVNQNYIFNVIDLIIIVDYILGLTEFTEQQIDIADINVDGSVDLLDVVALIQSMFNLLGRTDELDLSIDQITIYELVNGLSIETPGFVALDIELSHTPGFEYTVVNNALLAGGKTEDEYTRLIIADPESNILFETNDAFELESITALGINGETIKVNFISLPTEFVLTPAYPNPFNPVTTLNFALPEETDISIIIYNLQGRQVSTLTDGVMDAGYHSVIWNAKHHSSGLYFVQMRAGDYLKTQKLMLVK
jgi:hypothetical protein